MEIEILGPGMIRQYQAGLGSKEICFYQMFVK
jgi:ribosome modulation factor